MAINKIKLDYARTVPGHILEARYFYFEMQTPSDSELSIIYGGFERCASDFEISRENYPWYVLEYPLKGRCELTINSKSFLLEPGVIAGFSPGDKHIYRCDPENPMEHFFVIFTGVQAQFLFDQSRLTESICFGIYDNKRVLEIIDKILTKGAYNNMISQQLCSSYLRTLLLEIASENHGLNIHQSKSEVTFHFCKKYIEENYSWMMLPSEAAQACSINVRSMSRLFKQYHHCTPQEYIMRLKLNKAAIMLLSSDDSIQEIGVQVGFEDPYHFSKNFKQFYGQSPKSYRLSHG